MPARSAAAHGWQIAILLISEGCYPGIRPGGSAFLNCGRHLDPCMPTPFTSVKTTCVCCTRHSALLSGWRCTCPSGGEGGVGVSGPKRVAVSWTSREESQPDQYREVGFSEAMRLSVLEWSQQTAALIETVSQVSVTSSACQKYLRPAS